jgi:hypothetical protein
MAVTSNTATGVSNFSPGRGILPSPFAVELFQSAFDLEHRYTKPILG